MGLLLSALLLVGVYSEVVLTIITALWQKGLKAAGLDRAAAAMQQSINGDIIEQPFAAVATYRILYLSICLLLLHHVLQPAQWRLAWRLYVAALLVYAATTLVAKLAGNVQWAYSLSRQVLHFIMSPLPVAGLYVLFRAGFGPQPGKAVSQASEDSIPD